MRVKTIKNKVVLAHNRYHANKFFKGLQSRGGIVGDKAVLIVKNEEAPELSYIITERI